MFSCSLRVDTALIPGKLNYTYPFLFVSKKAGVFKGMEENYFRQKAPENITRAV